MMGRKDESGRDDRSGLRGWARPLAAGAGLVAASLAAATVAATNAEEPRVSVVRMADLEIDPAQLEAFQAAVKEEMEISVRVEPGVLAIYAVAEKDHPARLRFFEMYADEAAFRSHIETPHFRKFRAITQEMVVSRKLIEMVPIQLSDKKK